VDDGTAVRLEPGCCRLTKVDGQAHVIPAAHRTAALTVLSSAGLDLYLARRHRLHLLV